MQDSNRLYRLRGMLATLLAGVLLVALTEIVIAQVRPSIPRWDEFLHFRSKIDAVHSSVSYDALVLGDSTALRGILPSLFEERTGLKTYNFATVATASSYANLYFLREYLHSRPPPRIIVLLLNVEYLGTAPSPAPFHAYFSDRDLQQTLKDFDPAFGTTSHVLLGRILPSFRHRERILRGLAMIRSGEEEKPLDDGYQRIDDRLTEDDEDVRVYAREEHHVLWPNVQLLQQLCSMAEENNIPVYLQLGPVPEAVHTIPGGSEYVTEKVGYLKSVLAEYPGCLVDATITFYPHQYMADRNHTNHSGAMILTKAVADRISGILRPALPQP